MDFHNDFDEILFTEDEIEQKVREIGSELTEKYRGKDVILIGVLRGCIAFISDLMREIEFPVEIDFLAVSSYGQTSESSGVVRVLKDLNEDIEDRHVILVEDIVDSGLTLNYLMGYLKARNPASIDTCVLLDKPYRREVEVDVDYTGFEVPDKFLVGYGLDYAQKYRNLPYVATIKDEVVEREESNDG
jgi:hypoxanthine phosphoribosyltransferase